MCRLLTSARIVRVALALVMMVSACFALAPFSHEGPMDSRLALSPSVAGISTPGHTPPRQPLAHAADEALSTSVVTVAGGAGEAFARATSTSAGTFSSPLRI